MNDMKLTPLGEYHTFIRDNREARVYKNSNGFYVTMYKDGNLVERRNLYEHSEIYAENCAENWVDTVIK